MTEKKERENFTLKQATLVLWLLNFHIRGTPNLNLGVGTPEFRGGIPKCCGRYSWTILPFFSNCPKKRNIPMIEKISYFFC